MLCQKGVLAGRQRRKQFSFLDPVFIPSCSHHVVASGMCKRHPTVLVPMKGQWHLIIRCPSDFRGSPMVRFPRSLTSIPGVGFRLWPPAPSRGFPACRLTVHKVLWRPSKNVSTIHEPHHTFHNEVWIPTMPRDGRQTSNFFLSWEPYFIPGIKFSF